MVAKKLRTHPTRCIIFEDSIPGIQSAKRAGGKVIGVTSTHKAKELDTADFIIENFVGLNLKILDSLLNKP